MGGSRLVDRRVVRFEGCPRPLYSRFASSDVKYPFPKLPAIKLQTARDEAGSITASIRRLAFFEVVIRERQASDCNFQPSLHLPIGRLQCLPLVMNSVLFSLQEAGIILHSPLKFHPPVLETLQRHNFNPVSRVSGKTRKEVESVFDDALR